MNYTTSTGKPITAGTLLRVIALLSDGKPRTQQQIIRSTKDKQVNSRLETLVRYKILAVIERERSQGGSQYTINPDYVPVIPESEVPAEREYQTERGAVVKEIKQGHRVYHMQNVKTLNDGIGNRQAPMGNPFVDGTGVCKEWR